MIENLGRLVLRDGLDRSASASVKLWLASGEDSSTSFDPGADPLSPA